MLCPAQLRITAAVTAALTAGAWRLLSLRASSRLTTICGRLAVYTRCDKIRVWRVRLASLPLEQELLAALKLFLRPLQLCVLMRMATASPS